MTPTFARLLLWFLAGIAIGGCAEREHRVSIYSGYASVTPTWDYDHSKAFEHALERAMERALELEEQRRQRLREQI
ncbi:MAG: hypothetical protein HQL97_10690 [Magnetococcales bacterium]|nr:hypothetical protein [Magnetococcales bacterium]